LFSIAASRRRKKISFLKAASSQPKSMLCIISLFFSAEKTRLPPFVSYVNSFLYFFEFFDVFHQTEALQLPLDETPNSSFVF